MGFLANCPPFKLDARGRMFPVIFFSLFIATNVRTVAVALLEGKRRSCIGVGWCGGGRKGLLSVVLMIK